MPQKAVSAKFAEFAEGCKIRKTSVMQAQLSGAECISPRRALPSAAGLLHTRIPRPSGSRLCAAGGAGAAHRRAAATAAAKHWRQLNPAPVPPKSLDGPGSGSRRRATACQTAGRAQRGFQRGTRRKRRPSCWCLVSSTGWQRGAAAASASPARPPSALAAGIWRQRGCPPWAHTVCREGQPSHWGHLAAEHA